MRTVRTSLRSTPRTQDATSAMSAVCVCTSSVAGRPTAGGFIVFARSAARFAPSAIFSRARSGCRLVAPNRVNDSLTTTRSASGRNGSASVIVCRSPVISATGTRCASATSALMPLSPTRCPFSSTWEITCGL